MISAFIPTRVQKIACLLLLQDKLNDQYNSEFCLHFCDKVNIEFTRIAVALVKF